mmetsp:Transcript_6704/g.12083  ORF Transcript_6704/g.12083 Transcript_6704/m.12083 type:complete len:206 (+) Transcript_6704:1047-1664(+)
MDGECGCETADEVKLGELEWLNSSTRFSKAYFSFLSSSSCLCSLLTIYSCSCSIWFSISIFSRLSFSNFIWRLFVRNSSSSSICNASFSFSDLSWDSRFISVLEMNSSSASTCLTASAADSRSFWSCSSALIRFCFSLRFSVRSLRTSWMSSSMDSPSKSDIVLPRLFLSLMRNRGLCCKYVVLNMKNWLFRNFPQREHSPKRMK